MGDNQTSIEKWRFCPECGCEKNKKMGEFYFMCERCGQDWYSDVNYLEIARQNLENFYLKEHHEQ